MDFKKLEEYKNLKMIFGLTRMNTQLGWLKDVKLKLKTDAEIITFHCLKFGRLHCEI